MKLWLWVMADPRTACIPWARKGAQQAMVRDYFRRIAR